MREVGREEQIPLGDLESEGRAAMIETVAEFEVMLGQLSALKEREKWTEAYAKLCPWLSHITGRNSNALGELSDAEILAEVQVRSKNSSYPYKKMMLIRLLKEAGDVSGRISPPHGGYRWYLQALNILLLSLSDGDLVADYRRIVPGMEELLVALNDAPIPPKTLILAVFEFERQGRFDRMRDLYMATLRRNPEAPVLLEFGLGIFSRVGGRDEESLREGGVSHIELDALVAELSQMRQTIVPQGKKLSREALWRIVNAGENGKRRS